MAAAVSFSRSQLDQLPAARHQLVQFVLFFVGLSHRSRTNLIAKTSDDSSVDAVGFGEDAKSFGKVTNLSRIDDGHEMTSLHQFADQALFVPARGFDDDQACLLRRKLGDQLLISIGMVGNGFVERRGPIRDIQLGFGNVDSDDAVESHVGGIPSLRIRARSFVVSALATVRALVQKRLTILLIHGLKHVGSEGYRSASRRRVCVCEA